MVKIFKIHLQPNIKKTVEKHSAPKLLNAIRLAQFSGIEVSEKSKEKYREPQEILSLFQLQQKLEDSKERFKEIVKQTFSNVISSGKSLFLDLKEKNITQNALDQLKKERLLHKSYLREIANFIPNETKIPYTNKLCSDIPTKQFYTVANDSMIMSPRLLVHYIKGENTTSHYNNVNRLKKIYSSCSAEELFDKKKGVLEEFCEYTNTESLIPDCKFSKEKLKRLKHLTEKYDAINDLLKKYNIHTEAIEALFYSGIEKCSKAGDILPNKDIMLGFSSVYDRDLKKDIPTILSFANTDIGYRFKSYRYDEDLISDIEKYKKQVLHDMKTKNYKGINDLNNKVIEYLKATEISEVYIEPKDVMGLRKEMERCPYITEEKFTDILKKSKNNIVFNIRDLKNFNIKKYYNASNSLIKCLKEFGKINGINEAYTEALAFNNIHHSPVGLYLRNGFEPISISKEEIEKDLFSKAGFDFKKSVWLVYKL